MNNAQEISQKHDESEIVFHFKVNKRGIPLKQFMDTAKATEAILKNCNLELFQDSVKFELEVVTPEPGSYFEILNLIISGGTLLLTLLQSERAVDKIKRIIGTGPKQWLESLDDESRKLLVENLQNIDKMRSLEKDNRVYSQAIRKIETKILVCVVVCFLEKEEAELERMGFSRDRFESAYKQKARIYKACLDNKNVHALGFDRTNGFSVPRDEFYHRAKRKPTKPWKTEVVNIRVTSPNLKRVGRKWQGSTDKFDDVTFSIRDDVFWKRVKDRDIRFGVNDEIRVEWRHRCYSSRPANAQVLKVITFNGVEICKASAEGRV